MARFPYFSRNMKELGRLLAKASLDPSFSEELKRDPTRTLKGIGLPEQTIALLEFRIVDERTCPNARIVPFRLNANKLATGDRDYVEGVARLLS
mgnify:CR=1 FL=1